MKSAYVTAALISFFSVSLFAAEPMPIKKLEGLFKYSGNFEVTLVARTEMVPQTTPEGTARIKELRKDGYTCINKNLQIKRCRKAWKPDVPPAGTAEALEKFMANIEVEFLPGTSEPELGYDGSKQEWWVKDQVRVIKKVVNLYRVTRTQDRDLFISFPVSEDQPLGNLNYINDKRLGFRVSATQKESENSNYAYIFLPFLEAN